MANWVLQHFSVSYEKSQSGSKSYWVNRWVKFSHLLFLDPNVVIVLFSREVSFDILRKIRPQLSLIMNFWKLCHLYWKLKSEKQGSTHYQNGAFKKQKDYWIKPSLLCHFHQEEKHLKILTWGSLLCSLLLLPEQDEKEIILQQRPRLWEKATTRF